MVHVVDNLFTIWERVVYCVCIAMCVLCSPVDNRSFKPRASARTIDVGEFADGTTTNSLSSQQRLAVYQFLSTGESTAD